ncbi:MAG TPA: peptide-methionine (S)-S-oxide reductase MsrA [Phycisphaerales bacterium]|nr:peptide-methionine (S)-S-oxide reductase MsrA [Phycisphaerales bacterium]
MTTTPTKTETAMFGAGCFWGVEGVLKQIPGVVDTACGYAGGHTPNATYKQVCSSTTGHAEVVKIEFDPSKISYEKLVGKFFKFHDPTQVNRQGPDVGTQYRSAIFYYSPEQKATAEAVKARLDKSGKFKAPIATEIVKAGEFWRAEEYHQNYFAKNGLENNCHLPPADDGD